MPSHFEQIGAAALRRVVSDFYNRVFADVMIGFFFVGKDKARLIEREYELAARMLGGSVPYAGRPMREAHRRHPILGGHFDRRLQILKETLKDHSIPPEATTVWVEHTQRLRSQITSDRGSDCNHDVARAGRARVSLPIRRDPKDPK